MYYYYYSKFTAGCLQDQTVLERQPAAAAGVAWPNQMACAAPSAGILLHFVSESTGHRFPMEVRLAPSTRHQLACSIILEPGMAFLPGGQEDVRSLPLCCGFHFVRARLRWGTVKVRSESELKAHSIASLAWMKFPRTYAATIGRRKGRFTYIWTYLY